MSKGGGEQGGASKGGSARRIDCRGLAVPQGLPSPPETAMPATDTRYNRDEDQKPGSPPRPATEPAGDHRASRSAKTQTDPATGEPRKAPPKPA
jgi:hypothetical protein